jgi:hypothetical protein
MAIPGSDPDRVVRRRSFPARLLGALKLDASVYEEVEHDPSALAQAALVVGLAGLARGIGALAQEGLGGVVAGLAGGFLIWGVCAAVIWLIGVKSFGYTSDFRELLRTLGFAAAPLLWLVIGAVPLELVARVAWPIAHGLAILALVIAARQALDVSTGHALWVCVLAVALGLLVLLLLGILFLGSAVSG